MKSRKKISAAEERPGDKVVPVGGREFKQSVHEKMGADGVIETHVKYEPTKGSGFRKAGAGKGDKFRPVNKALFDANYKRIFGHD